MVSPRVVLTSPGEESVSPGSVQVPLVFVNFRNLFTVKQRREVFESLEIRFILLLIRNVVKSLLESL